MIYGKDVVRRFLGLALSPRVGNKERGKSRLLWHCGKMRGLFMDLQYARGPLD